MYNMLITHAYKQSCFFANGPMDMVLSWEIISCVLDVLC